ncbi:ornithine decarboxylase [uncultured Dialister sp.]|uniref:ornithine decarboxylase n=1 Tax=uncultured Dialister sp. TaxID=278064 RepID=UPI0025CF29E1|nr:ornithine decarboxylase [uncultured Dialister sp.]
MKQLKIALAPLAMDQNIIPDGFKTVPLDTADLTEVSAVVMTNRDEIPKAYDTIHSFDIPLFILDTGLAAGRNISSISGILLPIKEKTSWKKRITRGAMQYEKNLLPPFFGALMRYTSRHNDEYDSPGHHTGAFFRKHPAGKVFYDFYGPNVFRGDLSSSDVDLGDLLIHEGPALAAEQYAAKVFNADKTYFVLNGTSTSNKIVLNAALAPGDIVLYDRNNHKSMDLGLILSGAVPVYLETVRNACGSIGSIPARCLDEEYIRKLVAEKNPEKAKEERPIRMAVIELGTYDGCLCNARQIVDEIGYLCDYIFFDSAWVGYEQFIPMMKDASPLLLTLGPDDPGIFVTQSVHKQQAGFSMTSQIHKKDNHIKDQDRYVPHKRMNNAYMMHASTSPCYQLFAALDMNARIHDGLGGIKLWSDALMLAIEVRKQILKRCHYLYPFIPDKVAGKKWEDANNKQIAADRRYWTFKPGERWHGFEGYQENQYFLDPMKLMLITPGIDIEKGIYEEFGIPGALVAEYLRENHIIPEKSDLNDILFLITPAESEEKLNRLVDALVKFESFIDEDAPMQKVLPQVYEAYEAHYEGYTIRQLCQEMHNFYKERNVSALQKKLFQREYLPFYAMSPRDAEGEYLRGNGELIELCHALGRTALEGALPYPPGVICIHPGEQWTQPAIDYFMDLVDSINAFPGFSPELQGVYVEDGDDGRKHAYGYVLKEKK